MCFSLYFSLPSFSLFPPCFVFVIVEILNLGPRGHSLYCVWTHPTPPHRRSGFWGCIQLVRWLGIGTARTTGPLLPSLILSRRVSGYYLKRVKVEAIRPSRSSLRGSVYCIPSATLYWESKSPARGPLPWEHHALGGEESVVLFAVPHGAEADSNVMCVSLPGKNILLLEAKIRFVF